MIKAIFFKEWIKSRWFLLLATLFLVGMTGYCMLRADRAMGLHGVEHLWVVMVQKDAVFVDPIMFVPCLIGILLSAVQFFPEMSRKCLKLTLHLPCSQLKNTLAMLAFGVVSLIVCFALSYAVMLAYLPLHFSCELVARVVLTAAPWFLAGIAAYLLFAWICLEPTWKCRVLNIAVALLVLRVFFMSSSAEAYNGFLPWLAIYTLLIASLSWLSVVRFKAGKQD